MLSLIPAHAKKIQYVSHHSDGRATKPPAVLFLGMYTLYMIYQFCAAFGAPVAICIDSLNICF